MEQNNQEMNQQIVQQNNQQVSEHKKNRKAMLSIIGIAVLVIGLDKRERELIKQVLLSSCFPRLLVLL